MRLHHVLVHGRKRKNEPVTRKLSGTNKPVKRPRAAIEEPPNGDVGSEVLMHPHESDSCGDMSEDIGSDFGA